MKHRAKSSKIKYEHDMIKGLREFLENKLEPLEYISAVFPGEIKKTRNTISSFKIKFQYKTKTGAKLLAYGPGAVQEIFVVTNQPDRLEETIRKLFNPQ